MTVWLEPQPIVISASLHVAVGGHPLIAETLARRGIHTPEAARAFLDPDAYRVAPPTDLPDLATAIDRLREAIKHRERILVWGDFDADGQTATAVLIETLGAMGADVVFHVPGRHEGHGLHVQALEQLIVEGARLIVTCDTGITAHAAVTRANALGAEVIITDHHVPGQQYPAAVAVVNPLRLPMEGERATAVAHPLSALTGVGVAFQLATALEPAVAERTLDLVALGTVADVGMLIGDNRFLVQRGLEALRNTTRPGLQAIYQATELRSEGLTEEHISFVLGPRLNALGRLADAAHGVKLLTTDDHLLARTLATEVEGLNARRQWLTKQVTDAALGQIQRDPSLLADYRALVLSHTTWPSGVIGIVAGRLAERFGKPTVLITTPPDQLARGSGRSVPGVDLIAALTECAAPTSGAPLLATFGGHPGAAGFSIEAERIPELRSALSRAVAAQVETIPERTLAIDAYVELSDLTLDLVKELNRLAPFGPGNPPLTLAVRNLRVLSQATIGRTDEHRRITVEDAHDRTQTIFWWHGAGWPLPQGRFDLALTLRASDYRGQAELQIEWIDAREREPASIEIQPAPTIEIRDYRTARNPEASLRQLVAEGNVQVWAEGEGSAGVKTQTRCDLVPSLRLVVWTLPPSPHLFQTVLAQVKPEEMILFARDPGLDETTAFLRRLAGMVKFALARRGGEMELEAASANLAHRVSTLVAGLECLAAQGTIDILERGDKFWRLARGVENPIPGAMDLARARLRALLDETSAYRDYLRNAPVSSLYGAFPGTKPDPSQRH
jgi:single-stranded-DNA-specific exonuclease